MTALSWRFLCASAKAPHRAKRRAYVSHSTRRASRARSSRTRGTRRSSICRRDRSRRYLGEISPGEISAEHAQALVEELRAGAVPSVGELRDALGRGLCDATALEESLSAIVEERVGFDARLHAHASAAPADAAEVSADDAECEESESDEEKAMCAALERDRADAEALTAACDGASEPCPAPPAKPAAGVGSPDARLVTYERAVQVRRTPVVG